MSKEHMAVKWETEIICIGWIFITSVAIAAGVEVLEKIL